MKNAIHVQCKALISGFLTLNKSATVILIPPLRKPLRHNQHGACRMPDKKGAHAPEQHLFHLSLTTPCYNNYIRQLLVYYFQDHLSRVSYCKNSIHIESLITYK